MKPIAFAFLRLLPAAVLCGCASTPPAGQAAFDVDHRLEVKVPPGAHQVRVWFTLPSPDEAQSVSDLRIEAPSGARQTSDALGNHYLYFEVDEPKADVVAETKFRVQRREVRRSVDARSTRPLTAAESASMAADLAPSTYVVIDDKIRALAQQITAGETNTVVAARRIYDWVLANTEYWVKDPATKKASTVGSTTHCLETHTGNCTDIHSLWTSLARAAGIPTRMKYGSLFKPALDGKDEDLSYHCWPEFYAPQIGWVPLDVAVADIYDGPVRITEANARLVDLTTALGYAGPDQARVDYYFGNLDDRRVTWSMGRDLELEPRQAGGPVNAMAKAYVEIDGKPATDWKRKLTYHEVRTP